MPEGSTAGEFPLAGMLREVAERNQEFAESLLEQSVDDLRKMLAGEPRSNYFNADTDPVDLLVKHARQAELCRVILKMDDEAIALRSAKSDGVS